MKTFKQHVFKEKENSSLSIKERLKFYKNFYENLSPRKFKVKIQSNKIVIDLL